MKYVSDFMTSIIIMVGKYIIHIMCLCLFHITNFFVPVMSGKSRSNSNVPSHKLSSCGDMDLCSNYYIQAIIIVLVFVIAVW